MKTKTFLKNLILLSGICVFTACNDYLDEIPDNRTEIDTPEKVTKLLVTAYASSAPNIIQELMSDNMGDRGAQYSAGYTSFDEAYRLNEITGVGTDSPYAYWEATYNAIATANMALEAIEKLSDTYDLSAQKGEALLCRAYGHFILVNAFCQAYNPESSSTDLGIPYVYDVETTAINTYARGTVEEVYEKINQDIEEGLPLIDDNLYTQPKYHFNKRAAHAFAAQFNLYYGKDYNKVVEYADRSIGDNPSSALRDYSVFQNFTTTTEITQGWINSAENANLFLQGLNSIGGRIYFYRYVLTLENSNQTLNSIGPWSTSSGALIFGTYTYHTEYSSYMFPKQEEFFVYTDQVNGIGYPYIMVVPFTTEKTLIDRAEAYAMLGDYDKAARDLSYVYVNCGATTTVDAATINSFYSTASSNYKKTLSPRFTVNAGYQENLIHACLHIRRIVAIHDGTRLMDLKRFGIAYTHAIDRESSISVMPYDNRLAIQLPALVIEAGMEANPR